MIDLLSIPYECQDWIRVLAKEPIHILNLLTKKGGRRIIYTPSVIYTASVLPALLLVESPFSSGQFYHPGLCLFTDYFFPCLATVVPRVDHAVLKAMEAVTAAQAAERKKKRLAF